MSDKTDALIEELLDIHGDVVLDNEAVGYSDCAEKRNGVHDALRAEITALEARIAELEAERRPVAFSEREPELGASYLMRDARGRWQIKRYYASNAAYVERWCTHWLTLPQVKEAQQ